MWALLPAGKPSDRDRIDAFIDAVTGTLSAEGVEAGLAKYVDLSRVPLSVNAMIRQRSYGPGDADALRADAMRGLRPYFGTTLRILQQRVKVEGADAHVGLRLFSGQGMAEVDFDLTKSGEDWLVRRVSITR